MIYLFELEKRQKEEQRETRMCVIWNEAASFPRRGNLKSLRIISKDFKNSIKGLGKQNES